MYHVAIMRKSWNLIPKILDGRKKIESRWSKNKITPFGKVKVGDLVYFKNSGESATVKAVVSKVVEFENLDLKKVEEIIKKYGGDGGISVGNLNDMISWVKDKRYCSLIYLKNPEQIKPFNINKKGFGTGAAWLTVEKIEKLRM
jgi:ASC-1-like (ASCH) protein